MRILHVIPYMHPHAGGPPVAVRNFIRELAAYGHRSEIITTSLFCGDDQASMQKSLAEIAPTRIFPSSRFRIFFGKSVRKHLSISVQRNDIVHLHTLWSPLNVLVWRLCVQLGKPFVVMPHGYLDPYSLRVKRWPKAIYYRLVERKILEAAKGLIFTAEEERALVETDGLKLPKSFVVPLGANAPAQTCRSRLASAFVEQFPIAKGRRQLLFLGRLDHKKGLDVVFSVLPAIVRHFPEVLFTIAGRGTPKCETQLRETISRRGLQDHVLTTGWLEGGAKWGAYASAELFLLPSRQENFAITVAEAMQIGVPVLISDKVNSWPHVMAADAGIILEENRMHAVLQESILHLLRNPRIGETMGARGEEFARAEWTWTASGARLLECYEEVIGSRMGSESWSGTAGE